jgi:hypothetical protein
MAIHKKHCPDCKITVKMIAVVTNSMVASAAAQATGQWFGNTSYQAAFAKLWGSG